MRGSRSSGFDLDAERSAALNAGISHIEDVSSERLGQHTDSGRFRAAAEPSALAAADVIFICVPTPADRHQTPDLSYVRAALTSVARVLRPGVLVILQSTTYPGTTVEVCRPELEASGLTAGVDFNLAFSPERVDPGNARWTVATTPKVVGGLTAECGRRASVVLESFMDVPGLVRQVSTPHAAEMAKLLENTYRAVNIALVNELAQLCHRMGIDVWEVIDAAATKPFGFEAFRPGIGPGGHCIPVDPQYLSWKAREFDFRTEFIDLAADTNLTMADYVVGRIRAFADRQGVPLAGARVLCLGVAFKPGVSDTRNSRAIRVIELLLQAGSARGVRRSPRRRARDRGPAPQGDRGEPDDGQRIRPRRRARRASRVEGARGPLRRGAGFRRRRSHRGARAPRVRAVVKTAALRLWGWALAHPILAVFLLALSVRVVVATGIFVVHDGTMFPDDRFFFTLADDRVSGASAQWTSYEHALFDNTATFLWPLTAVFWVTGSSVFAGQLLVAVAGAGAAALTTAVGVRALRVPWAIAAGTVMAILPSVVLWSSLTLKDAFVWCVVIALALGVCELKGAAGRFAAVGAGIVVLLFALVAPA